MEFSPKQENAILMICMSGTWSGV